MAVDAVRIAITDPEVLRKALGLARCRLSNEHLAEECLQNAVVSALKGELTYDAHKGDVWCWFQKIVIHEATKLQPRRINIDASRNVNDLQGHEPEPSNAADLAERVCVVRRALSAVPKNMREVCVMRFRDRLSWQEIATRLKKNPDTLRVRFCDKVLPKLLRIILRERKRAT